MATEDHPTEARIPIGDAASELSLLVMNKTGVFTLRLPPQGNLTVGRASACDVRLDDSRASRQHAIVRVDKASCHLVDLGTTNGTALGERRLAANEAVPLALGDMITIGSTVLVLQRTPRDGPAVRVWSKEPFDARVDEEHSRAQQHGASFAIIEIRIDLEWLSETSTSTRKGIRENVARAEAIEAALHLTFRPRDVVSSHAAGTYAVLLPDTMPQVAEAIGAQLKDRFRDVGSRVSVGLACYPRDGSTHESLEARAHASVLAPRDTSPPRAAGPMTAIAAIVDRVAASSINALLLGETGVGKEVIARLIHERSARASARLVCINCAALSESLLESELFGHERGAFTGAVQAKPGLLEDADGGSVFLDEIGEMPLALQAKLLRVLEQREVQRVGSLRPRAIDVRFISATNRDLERQISVGRFREDLFFRLNGFAIRIPPLRDRVDEIEPLARAFVERASEKAKRRPPRLAPPVLALLERYGWPGNVRELRNVMERAVVLCDGDVITLAHVEADRMAVAFPPRTAARVREGATMRPCRASLVTNEEWPDGDPLRLPTVNLEAILMPGMTEKERVLAALEACRGNQTHAAKVLGVSRGTLISRIAQYDLPRPRKK